MDKRTTHYLPFERNLAQTSILSKFSQGKFSSWASVCLFLSVHARIYQGCCFRGSECYILEGEWKISGTQTSVLTEINVLSQINNQIN